MRTAALLMLVACGSSKPKPVDEMAPPNDNDGPGDVSGTEPANDPPPAADAPKPAPGGAKLDPTAQAFIDAHNAYRAKHCAPPLSWSPTLAQVAQSWANEMKRRKCAFEHSGSQKYGENLAGGTAGALDPQATVDMWYEEVAKYKFPSGGFSMDTGHFTQVVWTTTTQVGCGWVTCGQMDLIVCNYDPPGNWEGQYADHVLPKSCKK